MTKKRRHQKIEQSALAALALPPFQEPEEPEEPDPERLEEERSLKPA